MDGRQDLRWVQPWGGRHWQGSAYKVDWYRQTNGRTFASIGGETGGEGTGRSEGATRSTGNGCCTTAALTNAKRMQRGEERRGEERRVGSKREGREGEGRVGRAEASSRRLEEQMDGKWRAMPRPVCALPQSVAWTRLTRHFPSLLPWLSCAHEASATRAKTPPGRPARPACHAPLYALGPTCWVT